MPSTWTTLLREEARALVSNPGPNLLAGVTVALVALPLALAFGAQAFGTNPDPETGMSGATAGMWGAILGGLLAALLGGTPAQITGPDAILAFFVVTVASTHGVTFALLVILLAGLIQIAFGVFRFGRIIEFLPYPVIVGFLNGSAIVIFWRQVVALTGAEGEDVGTSFWRLVSGTAPPEVYAAWVIALATVAIMVLCLRYVKRVPGSLVALVAVSATAVLLAGRYVAFDAIPTIPAIPPSLPDLSLHMSAYRPEWTRDLILASFSLALLASINSLLTSVVADGVTGVRSDTRRELVGQGVANAACGITGAMAVSGAPVRTLVAIRAGGRTRLTGVTHSLTLLVILFALGGLAALVPLAVLAGILIMTAWGMVDRESLLNLRRTPAPDALVMILTTAVTVAVDLVWAVTLGVVLASLLFIKRLAETEDVVAEVSAEEMEAATRELGVSGKVAIYRIGGPLFFGAATRFSQALQRTTAARVVVFEMSLVHTVDQTGMRTLSNVVQRLRKEGRRVFIAGLPHGSYVQFEKYGLVDLVGREKFHPSVRLALGAARRLLDAEAPAVRGPGEAST